VTTSVDSSAVRRSTVNAVLAATTFAQVASVMGIAVFPVIAPRLAASMGVPPATIGYQISIIYGTAALSSPLMTFAVARWGACRTTQLGLAMCSIAMALALTSWLPALAATSVLLGLALAVMLPAAGHLLFRFTPARNRNLIFSLKQTGVPLAWSVMALAAPAITLAFGWQWAVSAVLAVCLVLAALLEPVREQWDDDRDPYNRTRTRPFEGMKVLWGYPVLRWLAAASLCLSFVQLCLGTFIVTTLVEEAGFSLVLAGVLLSVIQAAGVAGRMFWGWVADRTGESLALLQKLAAVTTACCLAMAFLTASWPIPLMVLLFLVFGAASVGWNGLFLAELARCSPHGMVSAVMGGAMLWNFGGVFIGPALFATVYALTHSYTLTYGLLTPVAFGGFALLTLAGAASRRPHAP
jgi:predicted MFS family arabinose efflux permease